MVLRINKFGKLKVRELNQPLDSNSSERLKYVNAYWNAQEESIGHRLHNQI